MTYHHIQVTDQDGRIVSIEPVPTEATPGWAAHVDQGRADWTAHSLVGKPYFAAPIPFVIPPPAGSGEPFYSHNHCPALTWCENGDLLAAWFSTKGERGIEMTILASRLRAGAEHWDVAAEFFKAPNRNMTGTALFHDGTGTLYHFNGMGTEGVEGFENLALLMRSSCDNGVTWTSAQPISSGERYQRRHQVIAGTSRTPEGFWLQPCDGTPGMEGPSVVHLSRECGRTWNDPCGEIRGIHAGVIGLNDGRLLAFGRAQALEGRMPMSLSTDLGKTWTYRLSPFPPIGGGQRLVLLRLIEGPLLLVAFTDSVRRGKDGQMPRGVGMEFQGSDGKPLLGYGLYAALSFDEGETWPTCKLLTPGKGEFDGGAWTGVFSADFDRAEPKGYLAATQSPDGVVHLISSRLHYRFNLAWLTGC